MKTTGKAAGSAPQDEVLIRTIEQLNQRIDQLLKMVDSFQNTIQKLQLENENLREQNAYLTKQLFAPKSEKTKQIEGQLSLFDEAEKEADVEASAKGDTITVTYKRKRKSTHQELMGNLEEKERFVDLPDAEKICPKCGTPMECIGKEFVRDEIEVIPRQVIRFKVYRRVYGCPKCKAESDSGTIIKAPFPEPLIPNSYATPSVVSLVMYDKYFMGMPLYRQEKDWNQLGVLVNRTTLANWCITCGIKYILKVVNRLHEELMKRDIVYCDETPVQVLHEDGRTATQKSYMWLTCSGRKEKDPPIVIYSYRPTRAGKNAAELLDGFSGHYLVCDGYQGYNSLKGLIRCSCLAHIRRKFVDAIQKKDGKPVPGTPGLQGKEFCDKLFAWERSFAGHDPETRKTERLEHEKPVLEAFWSWLDQQNPTSGSRLDKAVTYAQNQRRFMENYLLDGRIEISNQTSENSVRPFAVGRRNWLFSDSVNGAVASAAIYSLIETARLNGLKIKPYLTEVLSYMRDHQNGSVRIDEILPWSAEMQSRFNPDVKKGQ